MTPDMGDHTALDESRPAGALYEAIHGLADRTPGLSAGQTLTPGQRHGFAALATALIFSALFAPRVVAVVVVAVLTALYLLTVTHRLLLTRRGLDRGALLSVSDADALAVPDTELPVYTVLVPAYDEAEVIEPLLAALDALAYPKDRLDVKLVLEADDTATVTAVRAAEPPPYVEVVLVPAAEPRTKPKALNFAMAGARGELITIFDAEDRPEPLQLRRAVVALARHPEIACLQAKLSYYNPHQNLLTRWFTAEYTLWFSHLLPGLAAGRTPIPLGGTSNHLRREALTATGGWDPFNVTEDADLGIRLYRLGFRVAVLDSTTEEEANSDVINWVKQRSRWYKGYLQTWLVHMRQPRVLWHQLGARRFLGFNLFFGAVLFLILVNPLFWAMTVVWFVAEPDWIAALFPGPVYYAAFASFALGNTSVIYSGVVSARDARRPDLVLCALAAPLYWVLMSMAAAKAVLQLLTVPSFWEKTVHGLSPRPHAPG